MCMYKSKRRVLGCDARVQRSREDWVSIDPKGFLSTCLLSPGSGVHKYIYTLDGMEYSSI